MKRKLKPKANCSVNINPLRVRDQRREMKDERRETKDERREMKDERRGIEGRSLSKSGDKHVKKLTERIKKSRNSDEH
jgi:hypothetical protein